MELASYLDVLDADTIRVRGHRIDIAHVLAYYHEGYSAELIALELPTLSLEEVYGVLLPAQPHGCRCLPGASSSAGGADAGHRRSAPSIANGPEGAGAAGALGPWTGRRHAICSMSTPLIMVAAGGLGCQGVVGFQ